MWLFLKVALYTLLIPGLLFVWLPTRLLHGEPLPVLNLTHGGALIVLLTGVGLYLQCLWYLATVGRGTPLPGDAPSKLVQRGPYRWVRNPLYLATVLIVLGEALLFWSLALLLYTVFIASGLQLLVMLHEEDAMRRRFGAIYSDYCHLVPRWLPRRPRPRPQTAPPFSPER